MIIQRPPEEVRIEMNRFLTQVYDAISILPTFRQTRVDADYTPIANDYYIGVTDTAAPRTVTLPPLASVPEWTQFVIKDESGGAAANNITIDGDGAETIDGAASKIINTNYGVVRLTRGATGWFTW